MVLAAWGIGAQALALPASTYEIVPGKLHKGGSLVATPDSEAVPGTTTISIEYEIIRKNLVPIPNSYLRGTYEQSLPSEFLEEAGYLELETLGALEVDGATLVHQGRIPLRNLSDAHSIQIIPDNGKSEIFLLYHPSLPGLGWDQIKLVLHTNLPILGDYLIEGLLRP